MRVPGGWGGGRGRGGRRWRERGLLRCVTAVPVTCSKDMGGPASNSLADDCLPCWPRGVHKGSGGRAAKPKPSCRSRTESPGGTPPSHPYPPSQRPTPRPPPSPPPPLPSPLDPSQTVQYIQPHHHAKLAQAELLVIDEAAAIPLPVVRQLLGPYLVFLCSTVNGYEGTGEKEGWACVVGLWRRGKGQGDGVAGAGARQEGTASVSSRALGMMYAPGRQAGGCALATLLVVTRARCEGGRRGSSATFVAQVPPSQRMHKARVPAAEGA